MRLDAALPDDMRESLGMAFRELLCNAIEWGGQLDPSRHSEDRLPAHEAHDHLSHRRPRQGIPAHRAAAFGDQQLAGSPARPCSVRESWGIRAGGFGIFLVREMVDELFYNEAHNEVVFVKYLD